MSRRLPLIFVAVLTVIGVVVAGVAIAASGVGGSAVAYAVNGTEVSQATVDHQLKEIADRRNVKNVAALFGHAGDRDEGLDQLVDHGDVVDHPDPARARTGRRRPRPR